MSRGEKKVTELLNYEMSLMSYPCFGTVLALWDVFLHLVHLQLMREIPDEQLLQMRYRERETCGLSDRLVGVLFSFPFPRKHLSFSAFTLFCMDRWVVKCLLNATEGTKTLRAEPLALNVAKCVIIAV